MATEGEHSDAYAAMIRGDLKRLREDVLRLRRHLVAAQNDTGFDIQELLDSGVEFGTQQIADMWADLDDKVERGEPL